MKFHQPNSRSQLTSDNKLCVNFLVLTVIFLSASLNRFLTQRGDNLTHLRLNSCKFLNASCIETIGIVCDNLSGTLFVIFIIY